MSQVIRVVTVSSSSGVWALPVWRISRLPSAFFTSQHQPEPKTATVLSVNSFLKFSKEPKLLLIASAKGPVGSPPPFGLRQFQKKVWFQTCVPLLRLGRSDLLVGR